MKQILIIGSVFLLLSCSVSKRKYMSGYHIDWHKSTVKKERIRNEHKEKKIDDLQVESNASLDNNQESALASIENGLYLSPIKNLAQPIKPPDSCDILFLSDGSEIRGKVLQVSESEIKYKACDYLKGPTKVINKSTAFMIKYGDGFKEVFRIIKLPSNSSPQNSENKNSYPLPITNSKAEASLILGILSLIGLGLFTAIPALVMSNKALREIKLKPDQFTSESKGKAKAGRVLGIISILLTLYLAIGFIVLFS